MAKRLARKYLQGTPFVIFMYKNVLMGITKECVSVLIELNKNNGSLSRVGIEFILNWSLYLARTRLLGIHLHEIKNNILVCQILESTVYFRQGGAIGSY